ncbi:hypothetical protein DASC09_043960 [Saccharomycopsis crataegensis]|uniref:Uncharacterized protein n=1 Tax=Saccharomycopsis crataegensis TaxID=43959 RepID=A0AAV5QR97_9ASCO|nr:hypothetical protein DASC09_043960 [Saccharomycopsis crataegensis]
MEEVVPKEKTRRATDEIEVKFHVKLKFKKFGIKPCKLEHSHEKFSCYSPNYAVLNRYSTKY